MLLPFEGFKASPFQHDVLHFTSRVLDACLSISNLEMLHQGKCLGQQRVIRHSSFSICFSRPFETHLPAGKAKPQGFIPGDRRFQCCEMSIQFQSRVKGNVLREWHVHMSSDIWIVHALKTF